jgi:hypothetical protein
MVKKGQKWSKTKTVGQNGQKVFKNGRSRRKNLLKISWKWGKLVESWMEVGQKWSTRDNFVQK